MPTLYQKNRKKIIDRLPDGLILILSAPEYIRNNDVEYHFRQDSYFLYLTGISQPQHMLLLDPKRYQSHLFVPDISDHHRVWIGRQLTTKEASKKYKTTATHYVSQFNDVLKKAAKGYKKIYILRPEDLKHTLLKNATFPSTLKKDTKQMRQILDHLRRYKEPEELQLMQKANDISSLAHITAMKSAKTAQNECRTFATLENEFLKAGAFHSAYRSIVAGGRNAAILHYVDNNAALKSSDLLLIDAGCEWDGYAADITRTFPISGKFSKAQRDIYQIVLDTQHVCINLIKPGVAMSHIHLTACKELIRGLVRLGILKDLPLDELLEKQAHYVFFPHGIGHLLGLDVHDVGASRSKNKRMKNLRSDTLLEPNMVVTVEPGLYFIDAFMDSKTTRQKYASVINWSTADKYRSVGGIRIEDDIIVTKTGHRNLTKVPKEIRDIERLMQSR